MFDSPKLLVLKSDRDIKQAVAAKLGRSGIAIREDGSGRYDHHSLRELIVNCDSAANSLVYERLPKGHPDNSDGESVNLIYADVLEFCPIPLTHWQTWAKGHLENHRNQWLQQLQEVQEKLRIAPMCALPFGRFAVMEREGPEDWVSKLVEVDLDPNEAFENWTESTGNGLTPVKVWYFIRPYILWPLESPGALRHVSHIQGAPVYLKRPDLKMSFKMVPRVVTPDERFVSSNRGS